MIHLMNIAATLNKQQRPTSPLSRISLSFSSNDSKEDNCDDLRQCVENFCLSMSMDSLYTKQELIQLIHLFIQKQHTFKIKRHTDENENQTFGHALPIERRKSHKVSISRRKSSCNLNGSTQTVTIYRRRP